MLGPVSQGRMMGAVKSDRVACWNRPIDAATVCTFRILFGLILCADSMFHWAYRDWFFPAWEFRPVPPLFESMETLPALGSGGVLFVSAVAALFVALGWRTRLAALAFGLAHGYLYLWDASQFNNHNYLIVLLSAWISLLGLNSMWSIDAWRQPSLRSSGVPWWHLGILLFHIGLVYAFGALHKLNSDWLRGEPLSIWLSVESHRPVIGPWLAHPAAKYIFAYGGILFDALITPALCWRRSRWPAIVVAVLFHWTNSWMFRIGPFPWLMMATNVLFLEPDSPRRWWDWFACSMLKWPAGAGVQTPSLPSGCSPERPRWTGCVLGMYAVVHCLIPFRSLLHEGSVEWTEEGKNYSWRMMLSHKDTFLRVTVFDLETGEVWEPELRQELSRRQMRGKGVGGNPRLMAAYARHLRRKALDKGFRDPYVKVDAIASLNGRPHQYLVDPMADLATVASPWWCTPDWIVPLIPGQTIGDYSFTDENVKRARVLALIQQQSQELAGEAASPVSTP